MFSTSNLSMSVCTIQNIQRLQLIILNKRAYFSSAVRMNRDRKCNMNNTKSSNTKNKTNSNVESTLDLSVFKIKNKPKLAKSKLRTEVIRNIEPDEAIKTTIEVNPTSQKSKMKQKLVEKNSTDLTIKTEQDNETKLETRSRKQFETINEEKTHSVVKLDSNVSVPIKKEIEDLKKVSKREHIKVEYDEISPQQKTGENTSPKKLKINMPLNWDIVLSNLREMRRNFDAPVDSMGCHKCYDETAPAKVNNFHEFYFYLKYLL